MSIKQSINQQKRAENARKYVRFIINKIGTADHIILDEFPRWSIFFNQERDWMPESEYSEGEPYDGSWDHTLIENSVIYSELKKEFEL